MSSEDSGFGEVKCPKIDCNEIVLQQGGDPTKMPKVCPKCGERLSGSQDEIADSVEETYRDMLRRNREAGTDNT